MAAVLSCRSFVAPGHPSSVDVWPHLARLNVVYHALKEGLSPFYTFMFYSGFPVLRFYSPLFHFLAGPLALLTRGNLLLTVQILLILLHLVSAVTMFLYLRNRPTREERKEAGTWYGPVLGAIAYLVIPWRTMYLAGLANYPQALVYVLLPCVFLALESILHRRNGGQSTHPTVRHGLLLGLWVGLLFLSHLVYALFTLALVALWCLASGPRRTAGEWRPLGIAALAGTGVSAFFLVPFVAEQESHRFPVAHLNLSVPDWAVLLGFKPRVGGYEGCYVGLSLGLLLLVGVGAVLFRRSFRSQVAALLGLAISLFLTFGPTLLKEKQYLITVGLPPERFLVFFVFFAAILVPSAYEVIRNAVARRGVRSGVVFTVMAGLVMSDCLFRFRIMRFPDRSDFSAVREEIYPIVRREPHARLLDLNIPEPKVDDPRRTSRLPTVGVIYGGFPTPLGLPYHQYAPRSMLHVYPWVDYVARDIGDTAVRVVSEDTHKALALMGVSHFITLPTLLRAAGPGGETLLLLLKRNMDWDNRFVAARREPPLAIGRTHQGVVLAANRILPMASDTLAPDGSFVVARNWRRLLDVLELNDTTHSLNFIPVPAGERPESLPDLPALLIDSTRIRHQDVVTGFQASADCFLRMAVSYYPDLDIRLDGKPVPFYETADHFSYIRCPAGPHVLSVNARLGWLRIATLLLSLVSLPLVIVLVLRRRTPSGTGR
ncbi:hypothetical protein JXD38_04840 [candidate division WOR-3 bacterium]|nr:hypothetical protein [candidate division WOR-3 bacterium]